MPFDDADADDKTAVGFLDPAIMGALPAARTLGSDELPEEDDHTAVLAELPAGLPPKPARPALGATDLAEDEDDRTAVGFLPPGAFDSSPALTTVEPQNTFDSNPALTTVEPQMQVPVPRLNVAHATVMDRPAMRSGATTAYDGDPDGAGTMDDEDLAPEPKTEIGPPVSTVLAQRAPLLDGVAPKVSAPQQRPRPTAPPPVRQRREPSSVKSRPPPAEEAVAEQPAWLHPYVLVVGGLLLLALGFLIGVLLR
jgi:hypothetical protein